MNKKVLKLFGIVLFSLLIISPLVKIIKAESTDTVNATVTAGLYSVEVADGDVSFGTVTTNSTKTATDVGETQAAINSGTMATKLNIQGSNTSSTGIGWTLDTTAGTNVYTMKFCLNCGGTGPWTSVGIPSAYEVLKASLDIGETQSFDLQIGTPVTTAETAQQATTITIQAGAT